MDAGFDQLLADPLALLVQRDGEAADFGQFGRIDFQRRAPDDPPARDGDEAVGQQVFQFLGGARE